jgi:general stress protein 26
MWLSPVSYQPSGKDVSIRCFPDDNYGRRLPPGWHSFLITYKKIKAMPDNDHIENLSNQEAIDKIKEMVKSEQMCMFTTHLTSAPLSTRPMAAMKSDEQGNIWFFSKKSSDKNEHIQADPRVQLFFSNPASSEFLSVYGSASISTDRNKIEEYWTPMVKAWFQGGKDDPEITLLKVAPEEAYYWDTKNNKMVSMLKIAASLVTGKTMDDGVEGTLKVR